VLIFRSVRTFVPTSNTPSQFSVGTCTDPYLQVQQTASSSGVSAFSINC